MRAFRSWTSRRRRLSSQLIRRTPCYIELGRHDAAKAELTKILEAIPDLTIKQVNQLMPYKNGPFRDRFHAALAEAGLPE